ncbi:MAG: LysR family transcriptional regulator [Thiotrichales bacterium 32-46-8]|nr:LysR family transcriptional regulator [Gammaproteobacteria bacterium]OYX05425.1 MAG: LysR family transcriptional regulator [Thiotrichales bacterium 32-46-8]OYY24479.1 MAG: LysR family transcriptional regulator [Thiotrichales bacterium 35-46-9]OYZ06054.1 MAG: LysR family transcriptional regulator [Thiotrichales bacterium 16-46-22]OZA95816.1 MAG: LysR family transcriptional regulator [Thiotrichales bacterium 34-46-19]OZB85623.1 MAG: LysR family transcriptional regulator [Thiotrichales bacteri
MADRRLQVFHTVARVMSFTKAAEILHMTQPAVTFQIKQLEDAFNTRLFDRTHNKITLTEAGRVVYDYAEQILESYAKMANDVKDLTGDITGALVIGASTTIAEYLLPRLLGVFKKQFPDVTLRLQVGNTDAIVSMVENNLLDLGIVEAPVYNKNLEVITCRLDELVVIVPPDHPLAAFDTIRPEQLTQYPFILREEGSGSRAVIDEYMRNAGMNFIDFDIVMELGSPESVKMAVESEVGVAITSRTTLSKEIKLGTLKAIPLNPPLMRPFSHVRQRHKFRHRAVGQLLEFAEQYCKEQARKEGFIIPDDVPSNQGR